MITYREQLGRLRSTEVNFEHNRKLTAVRQFISHWGANHTAIFDDLIKCNYKNQKMMW